MPEKNNSVAALATGGVAAVLASACCLGPLLLVSLGLSGAWMGQLQVLEPYRPYTVAVAVIALFFAYRRIFKRPAACAPTDLCVVPRTRRAYKAVFWLVAALVIVAIAYPYVVPFLI